MVTRPVETRKKGVRFPPWTTAAHMQLLVSGRGSAWLEHLSGGQGIVGSNPTVLTTFVES